MRLAQLRRRDLGEEGRRRDGEMTSVEHAVEVELALARRRVAVVRRREQRRLLRSLVIRRRAAVLAELVLVRLALGAAHPVAGMRGRPGSLLFRLRGVPASLALNLLLLSFGVIVSDDATAAGATGA